MKTNSIENLYSLEEYAKLKKISVKTAYNRYKKGLIKEPIVYIKNQPYVQIN